MGDTNLKNDASNTKTDASAAIWFTGTKFSCGLADVFADLDNRRDADKALMKIASAIKLRGCPRAQEYLAHYLNGTGTPKKFQLSQLLDEDAGVRAIVKAHFVHPRKKGVITIGQGAYLNEDWRNSLGTYWIHYRAATANEISHPHLYVFGWGFDIYQWHPDDTKRFTQCIHQAAARLATHAPQSPTAKPFKMIGLPTFINKSTGAACQPGLRPKAPVDGKDHVLPSGEIPGYIGR